MGSWAEAGAGAIPQDWLVPPVRDRRDQLQDEVRYTHAETVVALHAVRKPDLQRIADLDGVGGLHALAVEPHTAAADRLGRGAAALEEARAPQPAVDTQAIGDVVVLVDPAHCVSQKQ